MGITVYHRSQIFLLPLGGYFFLKNPPNYDDVEKTLNVMLVVATLLFGCVIGSMGVSVGADNLETIMKLWYQSMACFGYLIILILCTYLYFTTFVHHWQESKTVSDAQMKAFQYPWALLMTIKIFLLMFGVFLYMWGVSYLRDDRVGRELSDEVYIGNSWQNALIFSAIAILVHLCFFMVQGADPAMRNSKNDSGNPVEPTADKENQDEKTESYIAKM